MRGGAPAATGTRLTALILACGLLAATAATAGEAAQSARIEAGQEAPAFTLRGTDGELRTPSQLRGTERLVLIFFRGVW